MRRRAAAVAPVALPAGLPTAPSLGSGEPRQARVMMKMTVLMMVLIIACSSMFS